MLSQTISLFLYLLLGIINRRLFLTIFILAIAGLLLNGFISELAIINSQKIAAALLADILRYSFILLALLMVAINVAEDFEFKQFEKLLTMPISRWQYPVAQVLVVASIALILAIAAFIILLIVTPFDLSLYWALALWMEVFLVGMLGLLAILSLEKIPQAVFFTLAVYLLSKFSGLISQMLERSVEYSGGSITSQFADWVFNGILYVIPRLETFAQNDILFSGIGMTEALIQQLQSAGMYFLFLLIVCLLDFYRKEFNI